MTAKILKAILSVAASVLAVSLVIITALLYRYFGDVQETQLRDELSLAASAAERLGEDYLKGLDADRCRVTWVEPDGRVRFDNLVDAAAMENHADREEVREALVSGAGSSARYSDTLTEQTIYEAVRLSDGSILRLSVSRATVLSLVLGMVPPMSTVLLIAMVFSTWLAHRMAKRVMEPLNRLDLERPTENDTYEELSPLLCRINTQRLEIRHQLETLKQKQEEFDQVTGHMREALVLLDGTGRLLSMNPVARALFRAENARPGADFLTIDPRPNMCAALREAAEQGQAAFREQRDGRAYQFLLSRIDSAGTPRGTVLLAFDVTDQMQAEENRRAFTANVSHELKTPLQSILGSAELLEKGLVKGEDTPRFVGRIRREAARLIDLIDDILRLSRLDEGAEMPREEVSLLALAREVQETLSEAAEAGSVTLEVAGDEGRMTGVRSSLHDIVYNLCENAVKYNRPGGSVRVTVSREEAGFCLRVEDTGIGIPPEQQEKIFERFYRVDKSHSRASGGTGLGLSIVKHAVQQHRGRITVESEVDRGTVISVRFPADQGERPLS